MPLDDMQEIGLDIYNTGKITQIREQFKLSRTHLAELLGTGTSTVSSWENKTRRPGPSLLRKLGEISVAATVAVGTLWRRGLTPQDVCPLYIAQGNQWPTEPSIDLGKLGVWTLRPDSPPKSAAETDTSSSTTDSSGTVNTFPPGSTDIVFMAARV